MNPEEYQNLARVETGHWFYAGKRDIVRYRIHRFHPLKESDLLVDCGAGTGIFADEMRAACKVIALDDFEESLELLRMEATRTSQLMRSTADRPTLFI